MSNPGDRIAEINERVAAGDLRREDSQWLLDRIAELEVELGRRTDPS